jgi:hypothetical protein
LNFKETISFDYNLKPYSQKWCNGDIIHVQIRTDEYPSGVSLKVFDEDGVFVSSTDFSALKELSSGYTYMDAYYTVNLDSGFYYFCICYGDIWLAQSTCNQIVDGKGTVIIDYSDEKNKVETIFKNDIITSSLGYNQSAYILPKLYSGENIVFDTLVSVYNDGSLKKFLFITGANGWVTSPAKTIKFVRDSGSDINFERLEVQSGIFQYAIEITSLSDVIGTIKAYISGVEIYTSFKMVLNGGAGYNYVGTYITYTSVRKYSDNGFYFFNLPTSEYGIFTSDGFSGLVIPNIYINSYLNKILVYIDFNINQFGASNIEEYYVELYDEDGVLIESKDVDFLNSKNYVYFDYTGNYYIKVYLKRFDVATYSMGQSVTFYHSGTIIGSLDSEDNYFSYRIEGGFKPNSDAQKINATDFSDQEDEIVPLHQNPYQTFILTLGNGNGIPYLEREKLNIILALDELRVNFVDMTKAKEVKSFEAENFEETGNKILIIEMQPTINDHTQGAEYLVLAENNNLLRETNYLTL